MIFQCAILSLMFAIVYALPAFCVGALILIPLAFWADHGNTELRTNIWSVLFIIIVFIAVIFCVGKGVYTAVPEIMIETAEWEEPYNYVTHEIINLADSNEINGVISGRRRYVRGYIGETTTYHYYYKQYDGGMKLQKVNEKNATIYFTDSEPRAEWYSQTRTFWWKSETKYFCYIYIPEGSMTTEFEIDME